MAMDGRRLWRAAVLGFAVFLVVGGSVGVAAAAADRAEDLATLAVPAPRPGDRAVYFAHHAVLDEELASWGDIRITYEWLPERWEVDSNYQERLVHPLRATFTLDAGGPRERELLREASYDAGTGVVVSETGIWQGHNNPTYGLFLTGEDDPGTLARDRHVRSDKYDGQMGPCGLRVPFQGGPYDGQDFTIQARCDWPNGIDAMTFSDAGWEATPLGRVRAFQAVEDSRLFLEFDEASPFPVRATAVLSEVTVQEATYGRYNILERIHTEQGNGTYTAVTQSVFREPAPPISQAIRTPWGLDDADVVHHFPLSRAYAAALRQVASPFGGPTLAVWQADHPDAYLGSATTVEYRDRNNQPVTVWFLAWTDGTHVLGKEVAYGPARMDSLVMPRIAGETATVSDWAAETAWPDGRLPQPEALPAQLPRPADLLARYSELSGDKSPNQYGFTIACLKDCAESTVRVLAGRHVESMEGNVYHVNYADSVLRPYQRETNHLVANGEGKMVARWTEVESQDAVFPIFSGPPAQEQESVAKPTVSSAWTFPNTPVAATGISLIALLAGAAYYFWPALKGMGLTLFSRINDEKVLDLPARRRVFDAIVTSPGIHFMALSRKVEVSRGALDHHLRRLAASGLVVSRKSPGYTCYFARGSMDRRAAEAAPLLRSAGSRAVLGAVRAEPGLSGREVARRLERSPSTVNYHLQRLQDAGLVLGDGRGLRVSSLGEQAIAAS